ncbi:hypothetical protein ACQ4PT_022578 [Festuca glaucescens]
MLRRCHPPAIHTVSTSPLKEKRCKLRHNEIIREMQISILSHLKRLHNRVLRVDRQNCLISKFACLPHLTRFRKARRYLHLSQTFVPLLGTQMHNSMHYFAHDNSIQTPDAKGVHAMPNRPPIMNPSTPLQTSNKQLQPTKIQQVSQQLYGATNTPQSYPRPTIGSMPLRPQSLASETRPPLHSHGMVPAKIGTVPTHPTMQQNAPARQMQQNKDMKNPSAKLHGKQAAPKTSTPPAAKTNKKSGGLKKSLEMAGSAPAPSRIDTEKTGHRLVITSDVGRQILQMNQQAKEEWDKKQAETDKNKKQTEDEGSGAAELDKEKEESRPKNAKPNKEEDDKMRTTAANVAARQAVGGSDMLSKWHLQELIMFSNEMPGGHNLDHLLARSPVLDTFAVALSKMFECIHLRSQSFKCVLL